MIIQKRRLDLRKIPRSKGKLTRAGSGLAELDLPKIRRAPDLSRNASEAVLSDGGVAKATPTTEKLVMDITGKAGVAVILGKSS